MFVRNDVRVESLLVEHDGVAAKHWIDDRLVVPRALIITSGKTSALIFL
jgi:hypothetical protein